MLREQTLEEWRQSRLGRVTASRISEIMPRNSAAEYEIQARPKNKWAVIKSGGSKASKIFDSEEEAVAFTTKKEYSDSRYRYMSDLMTEILTGESRDQFVSFDMQRGIDLEEDAIAAWEEKHGALVSGCDFVPHPEIEGAGASPDGDVGDAYIETKCPATTTHMRYIESHVIDQNYIYQTQWQMECGNRPLVHFVSYDDRIILPHLQLFELPIERDFELGKAMKEECILFLAEMNERLEKLKCRT